MSPTVLPDETVHDPHHIEGAAVNRGELVAVTAEATSLPRGQVEATVNAVLEQIMAATAAGEKVTLQGFGTCEARDRAAREGRNPATGETLQIAASRSVGFKAGTAYKQQIAAARPAAPKGATSAPRKATPTKTVGKKSTPAKSAAKKSSVKK